MVQAQKRTVAVIDDDPAVLDSLKFLLEVTGHTVVAYASAMEFLEDSLVQASCVILDQHMPQMTGLELTAWLRAKGVDVPVLLITGQLSPAIAERAARLGIEKILEKPLDDIELLRFVDAHPLTSGR